MIKGVVMAVKGERAKVRVNFKETDEKGLRAYIDCWNPISAHPGDNVIIEYRKVDEKKAKLFMIFLPIGCAAAGGIFGTTMAGYFHMGQWYWPFVGGSVFAWLLIAYNYIKIFKRDAITKKEQLTIAAFEPVSFEIDMNDEEEDKVESFLYKR